MNYPVKATSVQLVQDSGEIIEGIDLIEGEGLCALYNHNEKQFQFVCTNQADMSHMLATCSMEMRELKKQ